MAMSKPRRSLHTLGWSSSTPPAFLPFFPVKGLIVTISIRHPNEPTEITTPFLLNMIVAAVDLADDASFPLPLGRDKTHISLDYLRIEHPSFRQKTNMHTSLQSQKTGQPCGQPNQIVSLLIGGP